MAASLRQQARQARAAEDFQVMPENWAAVRVFLGMATQWRRAGMSGVPTGLDYAALPVVAGALAVAADADLLFRLQILEAAALAVLAKVQ